MNPVVRGKRKPKAPCAGCSLNQSLCLCDLIPKLHLKTKVSLVVHARELKRTTNTGKLALKALANSTMRIRGENREGLDLSDLLEPEYETLLFYPSDSAVELNAEYIQKFTKPIQFIVPDGNWRQASKVHYRHHELKHLPRVMISDVNESKFHMRAESSEFGMATLQAIALALGFTEGPDVRDQLLALYKLKLERTLAGRGLIKLNQPMKG